MAVAAAPVGSWTTRLMHTLAVRGYPTVDMRHQPGPQMVSIDHLVSVAETTFSGAAGNWSLVIAHLQALKPMGVTTVSMLAFNRQIDLYLGRAGARSVADAKEFMDGLELWLRRLTELLPQVTATDEEQALVKVVSGKVGEFAGPAAGATLEKILLTIIEAQGRGSCVTVHPTVKATSLAQQWATTDLTSVPASGIANRHWLWQVDTLELTPADESNDLRTSHPRVGRTDFVSLSRSVTG